MGRPRLTARWLLPALAVALSACPERRGPPGDPPEAGTARADGAPVEGLRLSLPDGWTARPETPERLAFGPGTRAVARLERVDGGKLPNQKSLKSWFSSQLPAAALRELQAESGPDHVRWMGRVEPEGGVPWPVGLCARRVGGALFLGGTLPGATEAEVQAALEVCGSLQWGPAAARPAP